MKLKTYTAAEIRELRRKSGLTQADFWQCFATTQSGGSRYESGRKPPAPVQLLLNIAFGTGTKSADCVDTLRALAQPPKKKKIQTPPKVPTGFGILP